MTGTDPETQGVPEVKHGVEREAWPLWTVRWWCVAVIAAGLVGCGGLPRGTLHGKLTLRGEPLAGATVMFFGRDNQVYRADLGADGTYTVGGVPLGPIRVAVQQFLPSVTPRPDPPPGGPRKPEMGEARDAAWKPPEVTAEERPRVPDSYGDPSTSGLSFELSSPDHEWSADLE